MSNSQNKGKKVVKTTSKRTKSASSKQRKASAISIEKEPLLYGKKHYLIFLAGVVLIALGLILMSGGGMPSKDVFEADRIYSFRRTVVAPFLIILGLLVEIYGIFKK
jgi:hypothetical protein